MWWNGPGEKCCFETGSVCVGEVWESVDGVSAVVFEVRSGEWTGWVSFGCVSSSGRIVRVMMGLGEFWQRELSATVEGELVVRVVLGKGWAIGVNVGGAVMVVVGVVEGNTDLGSQYPSSSAIRGCRVVQS